MVVLGRVKRRRAVRNCDVFMIWGTLGQSGMGKGVDVTHALHTYRSITMLLGNTLYLAKEVP